MEKTLKYFLAANSCEGFISHFGDCYNPKDGWKAYIIKGGPGTGKSSFMKKIANTALEKNEQYILCPCSSDPQSLDAVILPKRKTVIMDGTAPHTLDPRYPAVCEEILNFGQFWNGDKIGDREKIIEITDRNKALHKTAQKYLMAAGQILLDNYKTAQACTIKVETKNFAARLCKKYIPQKKRIPLRMAGLFRRYYSRGNYHLSRNNTKFLPKTNHYIRQVPRLLKHNNKRGAKPLPYKRIRNYNT